MLRAPLVRGVRTRSYPLTGRPDLQVGARPEGDASVGAGMTRPPGVANPTGRTRAGRGAGRAQGRRRPRRPERRTQPLPGTPVAIGSPRLTVVLRFGRGITASPCGVSEADQELLELRPTLACFDQGLAGVVDGSLRCEGSLHPSDASPRAPPHGRTSPWYLVHAFPPDRVSNGRGGSAGLLMA
jgi:hypothetical protein